MKKFKEKIDWLSAHIIRLLLYGIVHELPNQQRACYVLRMYGNFKYCEIAILLTKSKKEQICCVKNKKHVFFPNHKDEGTVKRSIYEAREKIRELLKNLSVDKSELEKFVIRTMEKDDFYLDFRQKLNAEELKEIIRESLQIPAFKQFLEFPEA